MTSLATARALVLAALAACPGAASAGPRHDFLHAEQAIAAGDSARVESLLRALEGYPLRPYLVLDWAQRRLATMPHAEVAATLAAHADIPVAFRLRRKWMDRLAAERRFDLLLEHHVSDGDATGECHVVNALWRNGRAEEARQRMAALWLTGESLPDACDAPIAAWRAAGGPGAELAWGRLSLAVDRGNVRLARYLQRFLEPAQAALAREWLALRADPSRLAGFASAGAMDDPLRSHVLEQVFARAAALDPDGARALWPSLSRAELPDTLRGRLRERLGEALARAGAPDSLRWLAGARSARAQPWRAVAALRAGEWHELLAAVAAMPEEEGERERWQYWGARAMQALEQPRGERDLRALAGERSYYGFLAADRLGLEYRLQHRPLRVDDAALAALADSPPVRRTAEWLALERPVDARREWHALLGGVDDDRRRAAALVAHRWGWHEAAIRAAAAARDWDDLDLRFPRAHHPLVTRAAARSTLSEPRIYAVVRQESAFMSDARSVAGALGLMQLLPATAREEARRSGRPRPGMRALLSPGENLLLGSLYLARLERGHGGHPVLASAAYNAGPARVRRWRPEGAAMSSEVWIETVPFTETRRYLRSVLAYQVIYAERLGLPPPRLRDLMPDVPP